MANMARAKHLIKKTPVKITLPAEAKACLQKAALRRGESVSRFIERLIMKVRVVRRHS